MQWQIPFAFVVQVPEHAAYRGSVSLRCLQKARRCLRSKDRSTCAASTERSPRGTGDMSTAAAAVQDIAAAKAASVVRSMVVDVGVLWDIQ